MTVHAIFNDASLDPGSDPVDGLALLETLDRSFTALRDAVAIYDRERLHLCFPETHYTLKLPDGTLLVAALNLLEGRSRDVARRLRSSISKGPFFNEQGVLQSVEDSPDVTVKHQGVVVPAFRVAWTTQGICCSADRLAWRTSQLPVEVIDTKRGVHREHLANLWSGEIDISHRIALQTHAAALPIYENPGHHDPKKTQYKSSKSHIPTNAAHILKYAIRIEHDGKATWWALCEHGFYHRFQGEERNGWLTVHWNGTTNPRATGNRNKSQASIDNSVPTEVQTRLAALDRADDCGCCELQP